MEDMKGRQEIEASVLIPVYKAEPFIRRCLDSLVNQTYQGNYEILCIDDGSPDRSGKILDEYAEKYSFIRVYHQGNKGVARTRERAVKKAKGRYIFWVDADDYADEELLEKALPLLERSGADILVFSRQEIYENKPPVVISVKEQSLKEWRRDTISAKQSVIWNMAVKRDLWPRESVPEELSYAGEDGYIALRLFEKAGKVISVPDVLIYHTIDNADSIRHTFTGKLYLGNGCLWYLRYEAAQKHFPDLVSLSRERAFSGLVKAYCMHLYYQDLSAGEIKEIKECLNSLKKEKIRGRYRDKFLAFCIFHGWDGLCLRYARKKQEKEIRKNKGLSKKV